jgi:hypothetical protein
MAFHERMIAIGFEGMVESQFKQVMWSREIHKFAEDENRLQK